MSDNSQVANKFSKAIWNATKLLQKNYTTECKKFQEQIREGDKLLSAWEAFQGALVKGPIDTIAEAGVDITYWDYFLNASHRRSEEDSPGKIYYYKEDQKNRAFSLWETDDGRQILKKAGVPRLAEILRSAQEGAAEYLVNTELPWLLSFNSSQESKANGFFYIDIPEGIGEKIQDFLEKDDYKEIKNLQSYIDVFVQEEGLVGQLGSALTKALGPHHNGYEIVSDSMDERSESLLRYIAWIGHALEGNIPSNGFYFPGTAGYSALPDIGCAIGVGGEVNIDQLKEIAVFTDLSLYYSLKPFAPELEKAARRYAKASIHSAKAAIMSRNFSHNVGSHSLANPHLHQSIGIEKLAKKPEDVAKIGTDIKERLGTFHSYAQGRLDFLARAISASADRPEPLFFLNDVLERGFFSQGVLLDTLTQDTGFPAHKIEFHVSIQKSGEKSDFGCAVYWWDGDDRHQFIRNDSVIEDVVVGIPGGMIGTHALYAFLENVMRNAVKYGGGLDDINEEGKLEIHLRLEQCKGLRDSKSESGWVLSVWDNVSRDDDGSAAKIIRGHINKNLIDDKTGGMSPEGHGIQEMKLCAELLSGGEHGLRFPCNNGYKENEYGDICCTHCENACMASQEYINHGRKYSEHAITDRQPLRCYSAPHSRQCGNYAKDDEKKWLTYNLYIPIPILLGVVSPKHAKNNIMLTGKLPPHVRYYGTVEELAKEGAHIGILLDDGDLKVDDTLCEIARLHPCLPFRLMVVTDKENKWENTLVAKEPGDSPFEYGTHIPHRRVRICSGYLQGVLTSENPEKESYLGVHGWDAIVLRAYDAWLRVFKPLPDGNDTWKLCIGFEHGGETVNNRWKKQLSVFTNRDFSPAIATYVLSKKNESDTATKGFGCPNWPNGLVPMNNNDPIDTYLVFDNHGAVFRDFKLAEDGGDIGSLDKCPRFYQKIGLKDSLNLYQSLESPPASPFGFALFLYSLVEGTLTQVAILDERVAQSTADSDDMLFGARTLMLQAGGIFPLLSMSRSLDDKKQISTISKRIDEMLNLTIKKALKNDGMSHDLRKKWETLQNSMCLNVNTETPMEGVIMEKNKCTIKSVVVGNNGLEGREQDDIDILLIHEGVTDHLDKVGIWKDLVDEVFRLHECVPMVVRCSGRGRGSRHLHDSLPFLEFTEVSQNTYQSLNKPALIKALLGSSGELTALPGLIEH